MSSVPRAPLPPTPPALSTPADWPPVSKRPLVAPREAALVSVVARRLFLPLVRFKPVREADVWDALAELFDVQDAACRAAFRSGRATGNDSLRFALERAARTMEALPHAAGCDPAACTCGRTAALRHARAALDPTVSRVEEPKP